MMPTPQEDGDADARDSESPPAAHAGGATLLAPPTPPVDPGSFMAWAASAIVRLESSFARVSLLVRGVEESQRTLSRQHLEEARKTRRLEGNMSQLEGKVDSVVSMQTQMGTTVELTNLGVQSLVKTVEPMVAAHARIERFFEEDEEKKKITAALHEQSEAHAREAASVAQRLFEDQKSEREERKARADSLVRRVTVLSICVGIIVGSASIPGALKTWAGEFAKIATYAEGHVLVDLALMVAILAVVFSLWRGRSGRNQHRRSDDIALAQAALRLRGQTAGGANKGKGGMGGEGTQMPESGRDREGIP